MSMPNSNSVESRAFTVRLSDDVYAALILYVDELSEGPRKTSRVAAIDYLVGKALKAEKGERYVPLNSADSSTV